MENIKRDAVHNGFVGYVSYKGENGKTKRKYFHAPTRAAVSKKLEDFKATLRLTNGYYSSESEKLLFSEFALFWLETYKRPFLKPASFERLQEIYMHQLHKRFGALEMGMVDAVKVQEYINALSKKYSYSTVKKVYEFLNACFRQYRINYHSAKDPCLGVVLPRKDDSGQNSSDIYYTSEQRQKIVEAARLTYECGTHLFRMGDAIVILLQTGMRIGELLALKWTDVDFEKNCIHVTKNAIPVSVNGARVMTNQDSTKTKSGRRDIPLTKTAREAFMALQRITGEAEYVMTTKSGGRIFPRNVDRMFRCICARAGVPAHGVHTLRHSFASMLYENHCPEKTISLLLGHADISTTMNIYVGMRQEQLASAMQGIDDFTDK